MMKQEQEEMNIEIKNKELIGPSASIFLHKADSSQVTSKIQKYVQEL